MPLGPCETLTEEPIRNAYLEPVPAYHLLQIDALTFQLDHLLQSSKSLKECMHSVTAIPPFQCLDLNGRVAC